MPRTRNCARCSRCKANGSMRSENRFKINCVACPVLECEIGRRLCAKRRVCESKVFRCVQASAPRTHCIRHKIYTRCNFINANWRFRSLRHQPDNKETAFGCDGDTCGDGVANRKLKQLKNGMRLVSIPVH